MRVNFSLISTGVGGAQQSQRNGEICQHWIQALWTQETGRKYMVLSRAGRFLRASGSAALRRFRSKTGERVVTGTEETATWDQQPCANAFKIFFSHHQHTQQTISHTISPQINLSFKVTTDHFIRITTNHLCTSLSPPYSCIRFHGLAVTS